MKHNIIKNQNELEILSLMGFEFYINCYNAGWKPFIKETGNLKTEIEQQDYFKNWKKIFRDYKFKIRHKLNPIVR